MQQVICKEKVVQKGAIECSKATANQNFSCLPTRWRHLLVNNVLELYAAILKFFLSLFIGGGGLTCKTVNTLFTFGR